MKKLFTALLASLFLFPIPMISTEKEVTVTPKEGYERFKLVANTLYHDTIPENPNLYQDQVTYADAELRQVNGLLRPNSRLMIRNITLNQHQIPVFTLADGSFIPARLSVVYSDVVTTFKPLEQSFWLKPNVTIYDTPYVIGTQPVTTTLQPYQRITTSEEAETHHGTYVKSDGNGWIEKGALSVVDNRMEAVQILLNQQYHKANVAISVHQLETGLTAGVNDTQVMYSASISKLPLLYYVQQQIDQGKIQWSDALPYLADVHTFEGAYQASGSGHLPKEANGKSYTIEELVRAVAQESDNVATNILAYHVTKQYGSAFKETMQKTLGLTWDMARREVSAKTAGRLMVALHQQNGKVLEWLSDTAFDHQRIARDIEVRVSHKIGDAYDFKHDVAVVYTESPFVLSIFTEKASYEEISAIAKAVYEILK